MLFYFLIGGLFFHWLVHKFRSISLRFKEQEERLNFNNRVLKQITYGKEKETKKSNDKDD